MCRIKESILHEILLEVEKPTRYLGEEFNICKKSWEEVSLKIALIFPDVYEVGMSHLGLKILYHLLNAEKDILAERVYAPWFDMEEELRKKGIPLFSLESRHPLQAFNLLGFTLQYELSYTNILSILQLAQIPLYREDRGEEYPLVMAGGPNAFHPEPLAPFIDFFVIGEAEEVILEISKIFLISKKEKGKKEDLLFELSQLEGIYVPSLYPSEDGIPIISEDSRIKKRVIWDLEKAFYPEKFLVPYLDIVHDRVILEIARGCSRNCRFCQAGILYRPVRERSLGKLRDLARSLLNQTGYEEISLASLSSSDYTHIEALTTSLMDEFSSFRIGISLPSLRLDSFSVALAHQIQRVRKTGLTFAPEAGSQRLREVINKGINEEDLLNSVDLAYGLGWNSLKLYFMIGLPTETEEDIEAIANLTQRVYQLGKKKGKRGIKITMSISNFIPKPHTPFQWSSFLPVEDLIRRINFLKERVQSFKGHIHVNWHDPGMSLVEALLAQGDARVALVLRRAYEKGARFDGWTDSFSLTRYQEAFGHYGMDMERLTRHRIPLSQRLPWDHIDPGVRKSFLVREYKKAMNQERTLDCRDNSCQGCGVHQDLSLLKGEGP